MAENNFKLVAWIHKNGKNWRREALDQPEFIGEGLDTLETAREAAEDAIAYINAENEDYCDPERTQAQAPREICEEVIIIDADGNEIESVHA